MRSIYTTKPRLAVLLCLISVSPGVAGRASSQTESEPPIERDARALHSLDCAQVNALTKDVYQLAGATPAIQDVASSFIKMTSDSECSFFKGERQGVEEEAVADALNLIQRKMKLPDFTHTNSEEVHRLRLALYKDEPTFIGRTNVGGPLLDPSKMSSRMGPLEAVHIASLLAIQKTYNPSYQMSPQEWIAARYKLQDAAPAVSAELSQERTKAVLAAISEDEKRFSFADWFQLVSDTMESLGVDQDTR